MFERRATPVGFPLFFFSCFTLSAILGRIPTYEEIMLFPWRLACRTNSLIFLATTLVASIYLCFTLGLTLSDLLEYEILGDDADLHGRAPSWWPVVAGFAVFSSYLLLDSCLCFEFLAAGGLHFTPKV